MAVHVEIVTPSDVAWKGTADEVSAPGLLGEFGVLPEHAALLTAIRAGVVTVVQGGVSTRLVVGPGFAEVGPEQVTLIVDLCQPATAVDKAEAAKALAEAESVLSHADPDTAEHRAAFAKAALATARLDA